VTKKESIENDFKHHQNDHSFPCFTLGIEMFILHIEGKTEIEEMNELKLGVNPV